MQLHIAKQLITPSSEALLAAVGVPRPLDGARSAVDVIRTCLKAATLKWPDAPINAWLSVADHLAKILREAAASNDALAVRMSNDPSEACLLLRAILKWEAPRTGSGGEFDLTALIGRAIAIRAE